jgi:hypothetical protein
MTSLVLSLQLNRETGKPIPISAMPPGEGDFADHGTRREGVGAPAGGRDTKPDTCRPEACGPEGLLDGLAGARGGGTGKSVRGPGC